MTTQYLVVQHQISGTLDNYWSDYTDPLGRRFDDRDEAIRAGIDYFDHDDFNIATLVDGKLAAFGWGNDPDFDPDDCDLPEIARQLCLDLADDVELPVIAAGTGNETPVRMEP